LNIPTKKKTTRFLLLLRKQLEVLDFHDHEGLCWDIGMVSKVPVFVMDDSIVGGRKF
jgi:hypothetical protein